MPIGCRRMRVIWYEGRLSDWWAFKYPLHMISNLLYFGDRERRNVLRLCRFWPGC